MAYCQNCGGEIPSGANFCPNCGSAAAVSTAQPVNNTTSDATKTVLTAAGAAAGVSILGNMLRKSRRHRRMPPPPRPMGGPGSMGGHGRGPGGPHGR